MAELVREILIKADREAIFEYLVDPGRHIEWCGTSAQLDPRPGGIYHVEMGGTHPAAGQYLEVDPGARVLFSFGWDEPGHPIPAGSTQVEIELREVPEGTLVRLTHRGLPDDAIADHTGGWDHYLERLELVACGGDAGPDVLDGPS